MNKYNANELEKITCNIRYASHEGMGVAMRLRLKNKNK